ncbi:MAG TPA: hypothetical protein VHC47_08190 [Mucilaginibacter sp.]|nr:hypothetical protein [Mucilaginibacter sp.]
MKKIHLYFRVPPERNRLIPGDRFLVTLLKRIFIRPKMSGVKKVFLNLCKGFKLLNVAFDVNQPFRKIKPGEPVIVLGVGKYALQGYIQQNPVIAGIGLMTHPSYWPDLCKEYPVKKYLQHSEWTKNIYAPYYGADKCDLWPSGVDTDKWLPDEGSQKKYELLIYNKIMWDKEQTDAALRLPLLRFLEMKGLSYQEVVYGRYQEAHYLELLNQSRAMIFLCEHESQGFACCEAMSMNVPVFAWDQGYWLDPNRFEWGEKDKVPATSVPFFDKRCGMSFTDLQDFENRFDQFWEKVIAGDFQPRSYILENLTLTKSAQRLLEIIKEVYAG